MKLQNMTDFVLEQRELHTGDIDDFADLICRFAVFLKQSLELWMFVPCKLVDGIWVVLEEPNSAMVGYVLGGWDFKYDMDKYQQAKERCLFDGFEWKKALFRNYELFWHGDLSGTIEDLIKYNLELTQTAIKQIGL